MSAAVATMWTVNPFLLELIVLRKGAYDAARQRSLSRDVERRIVVRVRRGVFVERIAYESLTPDGRHVIAMRALAAVSSREPVFSHWSAAIALQLPILDRVRLDRLHLTMPKWVRRASEGAVVHLRDVAPGELGRVGGLLVTSPARTVVDIVAASRFAEGVVTADSALHKGIRRIALEEVLDLGEPRRGSTRALQVILFAHRDAESAAESLSRCTMVRLGIAPPVLQQRFFDSHGFVARSDFWDEERRLAGEVDGLKKFLDPVLAPQGAGIAVWKEKKREDRLLGCVDRLARWGYSEASSELALGSVLAAVGWIAVGPRATVSDYIAAAAPFG